MLRILETERERSRVNGRLRHVIYAAIPDHTRRSAGRSLWDSDGPRYELDSQGKPICRGPILNLRRSTLVRAMRRSRAGESILRRLYDCPTDAPGEIELFGAIVAESARLVQIRCGAPFTVLLWGNGRRKEVVLDELRKRNLAVLETSDWIPEDRMSELVIHSKFDWHPNSEAYEIVARGLAARLLRPALQKGM